MAYPEFLPQQYYDCMRYSIPSQFPQNQYFNYDEAQRQNITGPQLGRPNDFVQNNEPLIYPAICNPVGQLPSISQYKFNDFIGKSDNANLGDVQKNSRFHLELPNPIFQKQDYNPNKEQNPISLNYWQYSGKEHLITIPHSNPQPSTELHPLPIPNLSNVNLKVTIPFQPINTSIKKFDGEKKEVVQKKTEDLFKVTIDNPYYAKLYAQAKIV